MFPFYFPFTEFNLSSRLLETESYYGPYLVRRIFTTLFIYQDFGVYGVKKKFLDIRVVFVTEEVRISYG